MVVDHPKDIDLLLLIGPVSFLLLLQWLDHRRQIRRIAIYLRTKVESRFEGFGWETWLKEIDSKSKLHKLIFISPLILLFAGVNASALIAVALLAKDWKLFNGVTFWCWLVDASLALGSATLLGWTASVRPVEERRVTPQASGPMGSRRPDPT